MDWFVLFVANVQTGFGPFISVYLTTQKWTQVDIGLVLTVGSLAALVGQIPGIVQPPAESLAAVWTSMKETRPADV